MILTLRKINLWRQGIKMLDKKDLIYDLIFSEKNEYEINIAEYIKDIYQYDVFIDEMKIILKKSKVMVIREKIRVDSNEIIWKLKVKK
ncbi:MAG: hypothetical protein SLAVMIC_00067 [uncultured marine phage]|uniref:Uncharacterized protein n=1 Tax=uncultured marine phage TaxID=707152 RepID=A0A8D9CCE2_9VIRU|nr:MAG: hypothetical protein SLAVMIC_00067 [uncultured marine phage]